MNTAIPMTERQWKERREDDAAIFIESAEILEELRQMANEAHDDRWIQRINRLIKSNAIGRQNTRRLKDRML